jgi:2-oxo-4-hydroxy-4-carboxy-5-ureidoimidazoline decarboxylase
MAQLTLDELNRMDRSAFVAALGEVFEHAPWVAESAFGARPFASLAALYEAMTKVVRQAGDGPQMTLIKGHPDLAGKAAREGTITDDSKREQSSAGLDRLSPDEFAAFHKLNDAYHAKFDIPFIVCVRRHGKDSILRQFAQRLENDAATERNAALDEIFRIVALRLDQRIAAPERLKVNGWLSTHVLDTHSGKPAAGVAIELFEVASSGAPRPILRSVTNDDGRTDRPLIAEQPIPIAQYELHFNVGDYFARRGVATTEPPFLGIVPIRFGVAEPEAHYHVPIIVTPWSYSTYRGS